MQTITILEKKITKQVWTNLSKFIKDWTSLEHFQTSLDKFGQGQTTPHKFEPFWKMETFLF